MDSYWLMMIFIGILWTDLILIIGFAKREKKKGKREGYEYQDIRGIPRF